ncbi:hypothetical protein [Arthrobacter sp. EpRS71]|uniref:hypothetical protein n=1 Tax=Arthrobacter sp. EpRS71 TaxID=1743141 RepID=UPI000A3F8327|nr:hypothetical protein [Arthrobacter sp. EpRS71]
MSDLPKYRHGGRDRNNYGPDLNLRRKRRGLVFAVVFGGLSLLGLLVWFVWAGLGALAQ